MDSRNDRDMEPEESEGTFPQMEATGTEGLEAHSWNRNSPFVIESTCSTCSCLFYVLLATALSFGTTQSQTPIGFSQSTPISQSQQARTPFSQRIAGSPFSAGSHAPWYVICKFCHFLYRHLNVKSKCNVDIISNVFCFNTAIFFLSPLTGAALRWPALCPEVTWVDLWPTLRTIALCIIDWNQPRLALPCTCFWLASLEFWHFSYQKRSPLSLKLFSHVPFCLLSFSLLLLLSIFDRSVFGNSPGPRTVRRVTGATGATGAGVPHTGVGGGGIGLVDDAGTIIYC